MYRLGYRLCGQKWGNLTVRAIKISKPVFCSLWHRDSFLKVSPHFAIWPTTLIIYSLSKLDKHFWSLKNAVESVMPTRLLRSKATLSDSMIELVTLIRDQNLHLPTKIFFLTFFYIPIQLFWIKNSTFSKTHFVRHIMTQFPGIWRKHFEDMSPTKTSWPSPQFFQRFCVKKVHGNKVQKRPFGLHVTKILQLKNCLDSLS